jgi:DNA-binding FadR family transcriptional regulator
MERMGLVSQVEAELEKMLSLELLPASRTLPSEGKLSRCFGVSRGTVREALLRLVAKGLVVTHPGRQAQAVALGQAVSLENLGVLLDGEGRHRPERWRLLEGYLALKRDMAVELLAACCEKASAADLEELGQACFALADTARWDTGDRGWVRHEFDLLRLAAVVADRPGHMLLIHSLERAFRGMARWMQPHLDSKTVSDWAWCAMSALAERKAERLRRELPPLLQAGDERLLQSLTPRSQPVAASEVHSVPGPPQTSGPSAPEAAQAGEPGEVSANLSDRWIGSCEVPPTRASPPEAISAGDGPEPKDAMPREGYPPDLEESWSACTHSAPVQPWGTLPMPRPGSPPTAAHSCTQPCCCSG